MTSSTVRDPQGNSEFFGVMWDGARVGLTLEGRKLVLATRASYVKVRAQPVTVTKQI
jgi:hypothetical protein